MSDLHSISADVRFTFSPMGYMKRADEREARVRLLMRSPHKITLRCDVSFGEWRVTLTEGEAVLLRRNFDDPARVMEMAERGLAFNTLADRHNFAALLRFNGGRIELHLTDAQYAKLLAAGR